MERPLSVAMKPAPPRSILMLNDDCIAEVLNYLSIDDVFKVVQADARFRSSAQLRFSSPKLAIEEINMEFIQKYPRDLLDLFFEAFGKTATHIKFKLLPESELLHIVSYFSKLQRLTISKINITESTDADALPLGLEYLEIHRCDIAESVMSLWFPKLAPNLRSLRIIETELPNSGTFVALNSLQQLTELAITFWNQLDQGVLTNFIKQNKDLTSLTLSIGSIPIPYEIFNSIATLTKMEHLRITGPVLGNPIFSGRPHLFPSLKTLSCMFCSIQPLIDSLACESSLTSISIYKYDKYILPLSSLRRFKNLQNLELPWCNWLVNNEGSIQQCSQLTQLQSLNIEYNTFNSAKGITYMLKNMSNLRKVCGKPIQFISDRISTNALLERISLLNKSRAHPLEVDIEVTEY